MTFMQVMVMSWSYTEKKKRTFFKVLIFCITQQWDAGELPLSQEALFISSTFIVYALNHTGSAKHRLRNLHEVDSEWDIFTCGV